MTPRIIRYAMPVLVAAIFSSGLSGGKEARAAGETIAGMEQPTPVELERFIENYVAEHMDAAHAPGMVISIVLDGRPIFAKGFGTANLETGVPFTVRTPLRAGSVSKPVTSAAVLEEVEQGLLTLNEPISTYLPGLAFEDGYGPASTVSQLLTLQGGYPDILLDTHSPDQAGWQPLQEYLARHLPSRTVRPGTVYSYSSLEHGLLGAALEAASGESFDAAVSSLLFEPAGMDRSTFSQPLPGQISAELAQGYSYRNGQYEPVPLDFVNLTPGIGLVTTAEDMGRFMQLLLNSGTLDGERVLAEETVSGLLERQNEVHPYSRARTFGLSEVNFNGRAALYQDGNGIGFANRLVLIPEYGFGLFISTNHRALGTDLRPTPANNFIRNLSTALIESVFPVSAPVYPAGTPLGNAAERTSRFTGHYRLASTPDSDFFKVGALLDYVDVRANPDGTLQIGSGSYVEVEPLVFRSFAAPYFYIIFTESPEGTIEYLTFGGTGSYAKVRWYEGFQVQVGLAAAILVISAVTTVIWPFTRHSPILIWLAGLVQVIFMVWLGLTLARGDLLQLFKGLSFGMKVLLGLPWLQVALALAAFIRLGQHPESLPYAILPALASAAFIWFAWYWRLFL